MALRVAPTIIDIDQHVISEWLLKAFARRDRGKPTLAQFDKVTGEHDKAESGDFMVEVDAHSPEIERAIGDIEDPASRAAINLVKRVKLAAPGIHPIVFTQAEIHSRGHQVADMGELEGMRLLVTQHGVMSPNAADRQTLARFIGLIYQRGPTTEVASKRWGEAFQAGAQLALDRQFPGARSPIETELEQLRSRMLGRLDFLGERIASFNWWVVRTGRGEAFVLGDNPVVATLSLGHDDDRWRAIFAEDSYVIAFALNPAVALLAAPRVIVPVSGIGSDPSDLTRAINRLIWRRGSLRLGTPSRRPRCSLARIDRRAMAFQRSAGRGYRKRQAGR